MTNFTQQPGDLRARADEYQNIAVLVRDSDLQGQFAELATRYLELARKSEGSFVRTSSSRQTES